MPHHFCPAPCPKNTLEVTFNWEYIFCVPLKLGIPGTGWHLDSSKIWPKSSVVNSKRPSAFLSFFFFFIEIHSRYYQLPPCECLKLTFSYQSLCWGWGSQWQACLRLFTKASGHWEAAWLREVVHRSPPLLYWWEQSQFSLRPYFGSNWPAARRPL